MKELIFISVFILWYVGALIVSENYGKKSKLGIEWSFFLSMIFSPIIGFFVSYFYKK